MYVSGIAWNDTKHWNSGDSTVQFCGKWRLQDEIVPTEWRILSCRCPSQRWRTADAGETSVFLFPSPHEYITQHERSVLHVKYSRVDRLLHARTADPPDLCPSRARMRFLVYTIDTYHNVTFKTILDCLIETWRRESCTKFPRRGCYEWAVLSTERVRVVCLIAAVLKGPMVAFHAFQPLCFVSRQSCSRDKPLYSLLTWAEYTWQIKFSGKKTSVEVLWLFSTSFWRSEQYDTRANVTWRLNDMANSYD